MGLLGQPAAANGPLVPLIDWRPGQPIPLLISGPEEMLKNPEIIIRNGMLASAFRIMKQKRRKKNKNARKSRAKNR